MPSVTIRPTKAEPNYKRIAQTGSTGGAAALSDSSDSSYVRRSAKGAPLARFLLAVPSVPASNDIATIVPGARLKQGTATPPRLVTLAMSVPGTGKPVNKVLPTVNGHSVRAGSGTTAYTYETPASSGAMAGPTGAWSALLSKLAIVVNDGHPYTDANRATIYELFAYVYYCARPSASLAITPASPVTTTHYPTFTATLSALIESWQDNAGPAARTEIAYELKVFTAAQYGAGGFNPSTSTPYWSTTGLTAPLDYGDGVTLSSEEMDEVTTRALPNGTYRAYCRGRRIFTSAVFGSWATLDFTVSPATPPNTPTLTATKDDATQRVTIVVTPVATSGYTSPLITVERSEDGGTTWTEVRGAVLLPGSFGVASTIYDYEAARATTLKYRASIEATAGAQFDSAWTTVTVTGTISAAEWTLKAPLAPALNMLSVAVLKDPSYTTEEDVATFRPIGRASPVVVSMALGGADGTMDIDVCSDAEWTALQALRDYQGALLLASPFGWSRYIRVLARSWIEYGTVTAARRRVTFGYLEVDAP